MQAFDVSRAGPIEPFRFWLAQEPPPPPPPPGMRFLESDDSVGNAIPPGVYELAGRLPDNPELWATYYCIQEEPARFIILSCFDHYYEAAQTFMESKQHGERITLLLRKEWPLFFKHYQAGQQMAIEKGCLVPFRTSSDLQWCLARRPVGVSYERIEDFREGKSGKAFLDLQRLTHALMEETSMNIFLIPGFSEAIGVEQKRDWPKDVDEAFKIARHVYEVVELFSG
jgi:hypothetical protein